MSYVKNDSVVEYSNKFDNKFYLISLEKIVTQNVMEEKIIDLYIKFLLNQRIRISKKKNIYLYYICQIDLFVV